MRNPYLLTLLALLYALLHQFAGYIDADSSAGTHGNLIRPSPLASSCSPGATYIDFGAWIGPTALFAASYANRVFALEPDYRE